MASTRFFIFSSLLLSSLLFASFAASSSSKVSVALYYESLCPYSANFIVNYVAKFFDNGLISFIDLELIPYGNARIKPNGTIICQHGPSECLLNTVEACAISVWPDLNQHFSFIYCVESLVMERKYIEWESCFQKTGLNSEPILDCYENGKGEKLEFQYADQTDSLQPPHKYVPWVVVNGQPLYEDLSTGRRIGSGHENGGMYYLDDRVSPTSFVAGQPDPALLWHWRLCHPSVQKLRSIVLVESSIFRLDYESCELGKHHRTTYQSRVNNRSSSVFELVHSDV